MPRVYRDSIHLTLPPLAKIFLGGLLVPFSFTPRPTFPVQDEHHPDPDCPTQFMAR